MTAFSAAIEAQLSGATVRAAALARFDFRSGVKRLWQGFGELVAASETWEGIGDLGRISPVSSGPNLAVEEMTFQLFASIAALANFSGDAEDSIGREVEVFLQFFEVRQQNEAGEHVDWRTLDDPFSIFWGIMGPLSVERPEAGSDPATARVTRVLSVTASNALVNRARPAFGFYSDRDQKARQAVRELETGDSDPLDQIFINASRMATATVNWLSS